jgi:3-deoxy-D-manno-octulosonic-acid transferase
MSRSYCLCYEHDWPAYFQIAVALLNARMSLKSFNRWSMCLGLPLVSLMLSKLSLVIPLVSNSGGLIPIFMYISVTPRHRSFYLVQSTIQAVRFQLLHTPPHKIHFTGDLKYGMPYVTFSSYSLF